MTDRFADIGARIDGIGQLGAVVNAMRGIAAARAREARDQLTAVDSYTATIATAIGRAMASVSGSGPDIQSPPVKPALVLFCAEEGFAGTFSERVLDQAGDSSAKSELFLIGTRGASVAAERGLSAGWHAAMPSHSPGIPKLADHIAKALYAGIAKGEIDSIDLVFSRWRQAGGTHVERLRVFPFDMTSFARAKEPATPLMYLTPERLLADLMADYLYAQLCNTSLHAFAAENEARMEAMAAARNQIDRMLVTLQAKQRQVRQEEITAEIIELAAGETASRSTHA